MSGGFDGAKLKKIRLAKGIRQNALAEAVNISKSYLCDLEKGRASPAIDTLMRLATALGEKDIRVFLSNR